ncbi:MAG: hypothetical protein JST82_14175 [Bacteroidetes bacterium]|nr:hypothetical protein [Bacteroidota bacterium]
MSLGNKKKWLKVALINLCIVAMLGFVLRSKIVFSIPLIDYKNTLHAHSHFAFGGWLTLALNTLLIYELLSKESKQRKVYQWLLGSFLFNAIGMLISFLIQGYAFYSILFSTLFVFTSYVFAVMFIRDINRSISSKTVKLLAVSAVVYFCLSSAGPFTLGYLIATKSQNVILYKNAIYTYLHLQYNGYFTLSVFALFLNRIENYLSDIGRKNFHRFAVMLNLSVVPSLFLCYLWHYPSNTFIAIAIAGALLMLISLYYFTKGISEIRKKLYGQPPLTRYPLLLSFLAFSLKIVLQSLTIIKPIGDAVFSNRPVVIGFLHLVLLGFISLYLLAHYTLVGMLKNDKRTMLAMSLFMFAVIMNEVTLMSQGLGIMLMESSKLFPWTLWIVALALLISSMLLVSFALKNRTKGNDTPAPLSLEFKKLFIQHK